MVKLIDRKAARAKRRLRVRSKIRGTDIRPRLSVFRSAKHIYAQIIDDLSGKTLCAASSLEKDFGAGGNTEAAKKVGETVAKRALEKNITTVVFDRAGFLFHGRVAAVAEGARAAGLQF
ncbi:MAG: 50S ribosomal protein L18 [Ruminococcus sp.]|jgi:large subunit ribosomal protein L18|nr:50S ribosomal protein L18 [Ruminococcus sp.]